MTNTVLIKRSGTSSVTPTVLESGEIAINYADGKLFYKNSSNTIVAAKLIANIVGTTNEVQVTESSGTFTIGLPSSVYVGSLFVDNIEIDTTGATPGYALAYNGTKFIPTAISGGGGAGAPSAYSSTIGDGTSSSYGLTHNLGTRDLVVVARNASSPYEVIDINWQATSINVATIIFSSPQALNSTRVTIYAAGGTAGVTSVNGTLNQIDIDQTTGSVTISLPNNLIIPGDISVTGSVLFGIDKLNDVSITSATPDQFLKWNGSNWVNANIPQINALDDIGDVSTSTATSGQFLKYDGSNWINDSIPTINNLDDIGDVDAANPSINQVLSYNGSDWIATNVQSVTGSSYAQTIGDGSTTSFAIEHNLGTRDVFVAVREAGDDYESINAAWEATSDSIVTINFDSAPSLNSIRVLVYSSISSATGTTYSANIGNDVDSEIIVTHNLGTKNIIPVCRLDSAPYNDIQVSWEALTDNTVKLYFGSAPDSNSVKVNIFSTVSGSEVGQSIESLTNTNITSLVSGQFLKFDGSQWINDDVPTINTLDDVGDVIISSATPGQLLKWDGSNWVNSDTVENLVISGDLTVSGTTTTISTQNLLVEDNIIILNTGSSATPSFNAGIEVERGNFTNVQIRWNESTDKWQFTNDGSVYKDLGSGGVTVSDAIPVGAAQGDMWYESDTGGLFAFYDSHWIEIGGSAAYDQIIGTIQAKGDLLAGNGSQSITRLGVGSNGKKLAANSATTTGLEWVDDAQNTVINAKGDLLVGTADNTVARQAVGNAGQVLMANPLFSSGVTWENPVTNRNLLINGGFAIDQRGKAASHAVTAGAALEYTVDRWYEYCTGANVTAARSVFNPLLGFSTNPQYVYTFTGATSNTLVGFGQRIEAVNATPFSGSFCTLSAVLYSSTPKVVTWTAYYANTADTFGTLASPTRTQIATGTFTTTTLGSNPVSSNQFSTYFQITANQSNGIEIVFTCPSLIAGQTLSIANVQLERGLTATPFEQRLIGIELALCQRYYQRLVDPGGTGVNNAASQATRMTFPLKVQMRASPTSTISGTMNFWNGASTGTATAFIGTFNTRDNGQLDFNGGVGAGSGVVTLYTNGGSQYVDFMAEL